MVVSEDIEIGLIPWAAVTVGDDVVIADAKVAKTYATQLEKMGVTYLQG